MENYLRVNLLGQGPRLMKKRIYRAVVSQRSRNTALMFTQVTCPQVIRPTVLSAAAPFRNNVGQWGDQRDQVKYNCSRQVFIRLSRHQRRGTGGTSLSLCVSVQWLQTHTHTHTELCGKWKSQSSFSRQCHKIVFAKFLRRVNIHHCESLF